MHCVSWWSTRRTWINDIILSGTSCQPQLQRPAGRRVRPRPVARACTGQRQPGLRGRGHRGPGVAPRGRGHWSPASEAPEQRPAARIPRQAGPWPLLLQALPALPHAAALQLLRSVITRKYQIQRYKTQLLLHKLTIHLEFYGLGCSMLLL